MPRRDRSGRGGGGPTRRGCGRDAGRVIPARSPAIRSVAAGPRRRTPAAPGIIRTDVASTPGPRPLLVAVFAGWRPRCARGSPDGVAPPGGREGGWTRAWGQNLKPRREGQIHPPDRGAGWSGSDRRRSPGRMGRMVSGLGSSHHPRAPGLDLRGGARRRRSAQGSAPGARPGLCVHHSVSSSARRPGSRTIVAASAGLTHRRVRWPASGKSFRTSCTCTRNTSTRQGMGRPPSVTFSVV